MSISEKIKTVKNKIKQNKAQYNSIRQIAKISALLWGNVSKYEFLTGKDVLPNKDLLEKAATKKRFEYSGLGKTLKRQNRVVEKKYQSFDKVFNHDKKEESVKIKKEELLTTDESSPFYNNKYSFIEFGNVGKYCNLSFTIKYDRLLLFYHRLSEFRNCDPRTHKKN